MLQRSKQRVDHAMACAMPVSSTQVQGTPGLVCPGTVGSRNRTVSFRLSSSDSNAVRSTCSDSSEEQNVQKDRECCRSKARQPYVYVALGRDSPFPHGYIVLPICSPTSPYLEWSSPFIELRLRY